MAKKRKSVVITDVYSVIGVERNSLSDLARALNEANADAFEHGEEMWTPVGSPIIRDHVGAQILVVRKDELEYNE